MTMHHDSAPYFVSDRAQEILRRKRFTCDDVSTEPGERLDDHEKRLDEHDERMNSMTVGLGDVRADIVDLRKSRDAHEAMLNQTDTDDMMNKASPDQPPSAASSAAGPDQTDSVGGQNTYGPKGQVSGYNITTDLRQINNKNRRKFGLDEITDGPSASGNNQTNQADTITANSSKTAKSLDPGDVWFGANTKDTAVFRALAPEYYRRQQQETSAAIRDLQAKLNNKYGIKR